MKPNKKDSTKEKKLKNVFLILNDDDCHFKELSGDLSHCFFPLVNVPIIHYVMDKLTDIGMKNFHIFPQSNEAGVHEYFQLMNNYKDYGADSIKIYPETGNKSIGGIFRSIDIYQKSSEENFLLAYADCVIDTDQLADFINDFKCQDNDYLIMSQLVTKRNTADADYAQFRHKCRVYEVDQDSSYLQDTYDPDNSREIDCGKRNSIVQYELDDPEIYICSKHVISQFHDDESLHDLNSLIDHVLEHRAFTNYAIKVFSVDRGACFRLLSMDLLFRVSALILRGELSETYSPVGVFGTNLKLEATDHFLRTPHSTGFICSSLPPDYKSSSTKFKGNVLVNYGVEMGDNCLVIDSVIGGDCRIGSFVVLNHCIIMNNVSIGDKVMISNSLVCSDAIIPLSTKVIQNSVIDYGAHVSLLKVCNQFVRRDGSVASENLWGKEVVMKLPQVNEIGICAEEGIDDTDFVKTELHNILKEGLETSVDKTMLMENITRTRNINDLSLNEFCVSLTEVFVSYPLKEAQKDLGYSKQFLELCQSHGYVLKELCRGDLERIKTVLETAKDVVLENGTELPVERLSEVFYSLYKGFVVNGTEFHSWYTSYFENLDEDDEDDVVESQKVKQGLHKFKQFVDSQESDDSDEEEEESDDDSEQDSD